MGKIPSSLKHQIYLGFLRIVIIVTLAIVALVVYFNIKLFLPEWFSILSTAGSVFSILPYIHKAFLHPSKNDGPNVGPGKVSTHANAGQDPLLIPALHQLRPPHPDFTVRAADLEAILNDIEHGTVRCGVCGMSGIGKTALALVIADRLKTKYPDAQFFINLRGARDQPLKPIDVMRSVIRAYNRTAQLPNDEAGITDLYCSMLEGQRAIVLLDDAKDAAQITPLLPPASCLALITTRNMFTVPGLHTHNLETLSPADAHELLITIAPRLNGVILNHKAAKNLLAHQPEVLRRLTTAHALSDAERRERAGQDGTVAVADVIAHFCGYLPLALRAAASLIAATPNLHPPDYAVQLRNERTRLAKIGIQGVEIGVEASLNLSYEQLPPEVKRVFRQLSVFPARFDAAAAEAVCGDTDHTHLSQLVRLSLVEYIALTLTLPRDEQPVAREGMASPVSHAVRRTGAVRGGDYYHLNDLTRLFAAARLAKCDKDCTVAARLAGCDEDCAVARLRHAAHYKDVLARCNDFYLKGNDSLSHGLALFDREWPNIRAGQAWAATQAKTDDKAAIICSDYPHSGIDILALRQHPRDRIKWLGPALAAARRLKEPADEAAHLGSLGLAYADLGKTRTAIECYEQALLITRAIGDRRSEGNWLGHLGVARADLGETPTAIDLYKQALLIVRDIGDQRNEGNWLGHLGLAYKNLGETRQAIEEFYKQALGIARASGDRGGEGNWLGHCGNAYFTRGETRQAIEFYEQHLAIARNLGDRRGEGIALDNLGSAYAKLGETRQAIEEFYEQALGIAHEIGDRRGEGITLFNMALALDKYGERTQAIAHAEAALKVYEAIEDPHAKMVRRALAEWKTINDK